MSKTEQPLVSIVTPVYNGKPYLRECIESVLQQTYQNWEYIIVNNRSEDSTLAIAEEYARGDARIRVITNKEFVGQVTNHNIAFQQMSPASRFCKVVQADDWLFPDCVERMLEVAITNPSVGLVSAYALWGKEVKMVGVPYWQTIIPGREIGRAFFLDGLWVFGNPTTTMIRSDIIRQSKQFYDESGLNADTEVCFAIAARWDVGFVHQVLTFTRLHEKSVTSRTATLDFSMAGEFRILLKFGSIFLTPNELKQKKREYLREYYSCLARRALGFRGSAYWRFHHKRLRQLGMSINYLRLAGMIPIELVKLCLEPRRFRRVMKSMYSSTERAAGQ
jgi:glycosyltransferase involved in cell wall biosynthesis